MRHETHEMRQTSLDIFVDGTIEKLKGDEAEIVRTMMTFGRRDWSLQELHRAHPALDLRSIGARVHGLKDKGVLFELLQRECSITKKNINAVALRCFYVQEFETQRQRRAGRLAEGLARESETQCICTCCVRWRARFRAAIAEVQRQANPS